MLANGKPVILMLNSNKKTPAYRWHGKRADINVSGKYKIFCRRMPTGIGVFVYPILAKIWGISKWQFIKEVKFGMHVFTGVII